MSPNLILLCGTARAGKSTAADAFTAAFRRGGVAASVASLGIFVKMELANILGISVEEQEARRASWRPVWQCWGTEVRRNLFNQHYWLLKWEKQYRIAAINGQQLVVPDVRLSNEFVFMAQFARLHGYTERRLWVRRDPQWEAEARSALHAKHASEREWRACTDSCRILFNSGSVELLQAACEALVAEWTVPESVCA